MLIAINTHTFPIIHKIKTLPLFRQEYQWFYCHSPDTIAIQAHEIFVCALSTLLLKSVPPYVPRLRSY